MRIVLFDLDHTICNSRWRDALVPPSETWDYYHSQAIHDEPFLNTIALVNLMVDGGYSPIGFTMRSEKWRQPTLQWMMRYNCGLTDILMRPNNDFEAANTAKITLVKNSFSEDEIKNIHFIVDDREDVCHSFTDEFGITSLQVRHK